MAAFSLPYCDKMCYPLLLKKAILNLLLACFQPTLKTLHYREMCHDKSANNDIFINLPVCLVWKTINVLSNPPGFLTL